MLGTDDASLQVPTVNLNMLQHPWLEACCAQYEQMHLSGYKLMFVMHCSFQAFHKYFNRSVPVWWVKTFLTHSVPCACVFTFLTTDTRMQACARTHTHAR